jgi:integrase
MASTDKLTATAVDGAKRREKPYKLFDGGGLYLIVKPDGARWWRLKYRLDGVEKLISLGTYPARSLKAARTARDAARALLIDGVDPSRKRQADRANRRSARENTFEAVAREWYGKRSRKWAASHAGKVMGRLVKHMFPSIGATPMGELTGAGLGHALQEIEQASTPSTAHRCRQYLDSICRYAMQTARIQSNPTPHSETLAAVVSRSFASITDPKGVGGLMRAIRGYQGAPMTVAALKLAPLLFVRPGELRAAQWSEMNLDAAEWLIPAERMKMRRAHLVPLSDQAVAILRDLRRLTGSSSFVFPSERSPGRCMSENTLNAALRTLGYTKAQMTSHGFRHMASTMLNESRKFRGDVIERQLAHADRNAIRAVYNAAEYLDERKSMMQWWADRLDSLASANNVVAIKARG